MVEDSLIFVLPDGRSTEVSSRSANLIYNRLWELGVSAGAATAAMRIGDALNHGLNPFRATEVAFTEREVAPLIEAAKSYPPTWRSLAEPGALETISLAQRRQLLDTCLELIDGLNADVDHGKLRALVVELERVRDQLRAMSAREMLHAAAERVAFGWCQGTEARASDGRPVEVTDPQAVLWSLLGALQAADVAGHVARVEEITIAVAAIAELIVDPSLAHWNDESNRTQQEVHAVLEGAEALTAQTVELFD
jgi:hypothetical protein